MGKPKTPPPKYASWSEFLEKIEPSQLKKMCESRTNKANADRLMSAAPTRRITAANVWSILNETQGRCTYCGSLCVETLPYKIGKYSAKKLPWEHIGRRIGSLEHLIQRVKGGCNEPWNLAWACLWCNTWDSERRLGATDHGGIYPAFDNTVFGDDDPPSPPWVNDWWEGVEDFDEHLDFAYSCGDEYLLRQNYPDVAEGIITVKRKTEEYIGRRRGNI